MGVKLVLAVREGWKATQNDRFGEVLEVRFVNVLPDKTEQIMFRYAPKLDEEEIWRKVFKELNEYDVMLKQLKNKTQMLNGMVFLTNGEGCKQ